MDEPEEQSADEGAALAEPPTDDPEALRTLAESYLERDQPAEAAAVYTRLAELTPADPDPREVRIARAAIRIEQNDYEAALADLDAALAAPPGGADRAYDHLSTARVYLRRAQVNYNLKRLDAAEADARAALDLAPAGPQAP